MAHHLHQFRYIMALAASMCAASTALCQTTPTVIPLPAQVKAVAAKDQPAVVIMQLQPTRADVYWITRDGKRYLFAEAQAFKTGHDGKVELIRAETTPQYGDFVVTKSPGATVDFAVDVPADGSYTLWVRFIHHGDTSPVTRLSVDGQDVGELKNFWWQKSPELKLKAGKHDIRITEANPIPPLPGNRMVGIDVLAMTDDPKFKPGNMLTVDPLRPDVNAWLPRPEQNMRSLDISAGGAKLNLTQTWQSGDLIAVSADGAYVTTGTGASHGTFKYDASNSLTITDAHADHNAGAAIATATIGRARLAPGGVITLTPNGDMVGDQATFAVTEPGRLRITRFDGRVVAEPANGVYMWDGRDSQGKLLQSGVYIAIFEPHNAISVKTVWLVSSQIDAPAMATRSIKEITPNGDNVYDEVEIKLRTAPAADDRVVVRNAAGTVIRSGLRASGQMIKWDGKDDSGQVAPAGLFDVIVLGRQSELKAGVQVDVVNLPAWPDQVYRGEHYPLGVWYDLAQKPRAMPLDQYLQSTFSDIKAHGANSVVAVFGDQPRKVLDAARQHGLTVVWSIMPVTLGKILHATEPMTEREMIAILKPVIDPIKDHPAMAGYYIADEPEKKDGVGARMRAVQQVMAGLDQKHPALACLIGPDRVPVFAKQMRVPLLFIDVYPLRPNSPIGDFNNIWGYKNLQAMKYVDDCMASVKEWGAPTWIILQTHKFTGWHREPTPEEMRLQTWLSISRAVKGIYFFIYQTEQDWIGLVDKDHKETQRWRMLGEVYREVQNITPVLLKLNRVDDVATLVGGGNKYYPHGEITTLSDGDRTYLVVANKDVENEQTVEIALRQQATALIDMKSKEKLPVVAGKVLLKLRAGDGTLLLIER